MSRTIALFYLTVFLKKNQCTSTSHTILLVLLEFFHLILPVWVLMYLFYHQFRKTVNARIRVFSGSHFLESASSSQNYEDSGFFTDLEDERFYSSLKHIRQVND